MSAERILVIDDEPNVINLCQRALEKEGFEVKGAPNAAEGLHLLKVGQVGNLSYDLTLLDVKLPDRDGLDVLSTIREMDPQMAMVIITGYGTMEVAIRALKAGTQGFLLKPFTPEELVTSVQKVLERERLTQENLRLKAHLPILEISKALVSEVNLERLAQFILGTVQQELGADRVSLMLLDEERQELSISAALGFPGEVVTTTRVRMGQGLADLAVRKRKPILLSEHAENDLAIQAQSPAPGEGSAICMPLMLKDRVLGVLNAGRAPDDAPSRQDDVDLLSILGGQIAVAIENARLFEQVQQREIAERKRVEEALRRAHDELETRVQERTAELARANEALRAEIAEHERTEEALQQTHAQNQQLLASISSILIGVSPDDRITHWNTPAETAFGSAAADVIGRPFVECGIQWDWTEITRRIADCRKENRPIRLGDIQYTRPDGKDGVLDITLNPFVEEKPTQPGFLLLGEETTERKILEMQLAQAQKLEAIGQLAAGVAHEINTPIQYVGDNTRFVQESFADVSTLLEKLHRLLKAARAGSVPPELIAEVENAIDEADMKYLSKEISTAIQESLEGVARVAEIVRAMREFSHPGVEKKMAIDINRAIESTITVGRNEWKDVAEMKTDFDSDLPLVPCLPGEFNQVILNVLSTPPMLSPTQ